MLKTPRPSVLRQIQDLDIMNALIQFAADSDDILKGNKQVLCITSTSSANSTEGISVTSAATTSQPGNKEIFDIKDISETQSTTSLSHTSYSTASISAVKSMKYATSRRRPILKQSEDLLSEAKRKTLLCSNEQATEQREVTLRIMTLQEKQEKEKLKQTIEKTEQEKLRTSVLL